jgi:hypothetical protein
MEELITCLMSAGRSPTRASWLTTSSPTYERTVKRVAHCSPKRPMGSTMAWECAPVSKSTRPSEESGMPDQPTYLRQVLDHLGLVAGMFDELGLADVLD